MNSHNDIAHGSDYDICDTERNVAVYEYCNGS